MKSFVFTWLKIFWKELAIMKIVLRGHTPPIHRYDNSNHDSESKILHDNILQLPPAVVPVLNAAEILPTTLNNNVYDDVYPTSPVPYPVDRRTEGRKIGSHIPMQSTR